jgi:hypothetical protein
MKNDTPGEERVIPLAQIQIGSRTSFSPLITGQASKHTKRSRHTDIKTIKQKMRTHHVVKNRQHQKWAIHNTNSTATLTKPRYMNSTVCCDTLITTARARRHQLSSARCISPPPNRLQIQQHNTFQFAQNGCRHRKISRAPGLPGE